MKNIGETAEIMELDKRLTIDDLITAFVEYEQNKDSLEAIVDYYKLQLKLMQKMFGVDFADFETRIRAKELPPEHLENLEKYYEFNALITINHFKYCIILLSRFKYPFDHGMLAGMPPKISRDLEEKYGNKSLGIINELDNIYREIAKKLLDFMFPDIESTQVDGKRLYELGLPEEEPDYWDLLLEEEDDEFD